MLHKKGNFHPFFSSSVKTKRFFFEKVIILALTIGFSWYFSSTIQDVRLFRWFDIDGIMTVWATWTRNSWNFDPKNKNLHFDENGNNLEWLKVFYAWNKWHFMVKIQILQIFLELTFLYFNNVLSHIENVCNINTCTFFHNISDLVFWIVGFFLLFSFFLSFIMLQIQLQIPSSEVTLVLGEVTPDDGKKKC